MLTKYDFTRFLKRNYLWLVWVIAFLSTVSSLFISEIMELPPCDFCWYQRIAMYGIFVVTTVALVWPDRYIYRYVLALAIPGVIFGIIQYLMQKTTFLQTVETCSIDNPCSEILVEWFGFITIPLMSVVAFISMITLTVVYLRLRD